MVLVNFLRGFGVSLQFLTRIPLPQRLLEKKQVNASTLWFPLVGLVVGLVAVLAWMAARMVVAEGVARLLSLSAWVWVSSAFHMDGLADSLDGFYGGKTKVQVLKIMKDPALGAIGGVGLLTVFSLKVVSLLYLPTHWFLPVVLAASVGGHTAMAVSLSLPYAKKKGLGLLFQDREHAWTLSAVVVLGLVLVLGLLGPKAWLPLAVAAGMTAGWLFYSYRRLQGVTGDVCGATGELVETLMLAFSTALAGLPLFFGIGQ